MPYTIQSVSLGRSGPNSKVETNDSTPVAPDECTGPVDPTGTPYLRTAPLVPGYALSHWYVLSGGPGQRSMTANEQLSDHPVRFSRSSDTPIWLHNNTATRSTQSTSVADIAGANQCVPGPICCLIPPPGSKVCPKQHTPRHRPPSHPNPAQLGLKVHDSSRCRASGSAERQQFRPRGSHTNSSRCCASGSAERQQFRPRGSHTMIDL